MQLSLNWIKIDKISVILVESAGNTHGDINKLNEL